MRRSERAKDNQVLILVVGVIVVGVLLGAL